MSMTEVRPIFGQSIQPMSQIIAAQPLTKIQGEVYGGLQNFWGRIRDECEEIFTPAQCRALLGARPTILSPVHPARQEGIKWYWLVAFGFVVGKVISR